MISTFGATLDVQLTVANPFCLIVLSAPTDVQGHSNRSIVPFIACGDLR